MPEQVQLAWAEHVGRSVAFPGPDTDEWVIRYLHLDLVPPPGAVAGFLAAVLLDGDGVGMPYPATFRLRSQPLNPVLEALVPVRATAATTTPATTATTTVRAAPTLPAYATAV